MGITPGLTYEAIEALMIAENDSDSRQLQIQFNTFVATKECKTVPKGLDEIVEYIQILVPQCPPDFRDPEVSSKHFLRLAILGQPRADYTIRHLTAHKYIFMQFRTALQESI